MSITTTTHLNFTGTARAALEFYAEVFGGEVSIATYAQFGMPAELPGASNVVFGRVDAPNGFRVLAYDTPGRPGEGLAGTAGETRREQGATVTSAPFFLAASGETLDEVTGYWEALSAGADVIEPLAASAWSPGFGMLSDRFGVTWVLDVVVTP
ncbi:MULTISPECIES: VOC family protein [unclassified Pseudoclavibacter]|uniref:VOC family protein n=1 Tax=unclassified Pseudoclavibacter TaxID=2615177 RepID=UPI001BAD81B5|nr:VOC family protein [Pseudoclavibacter sp. Marseille-Q4354]MBS3179380.1 VOC family protein [Pseudoclavibacter sp. Marseille-Q4354]